VPNVAVAKLTLLISVITLGTDRPTVLQGIVERSLRCIPIFGGCAVTVAREFDKKIIHFGMVGSGSPPSSNRRGLWAGRHPAAQSHAVPPRVRPSPRHGCASREHLRRALTPMRSILNDHHTHSWFWRRDPWGNRVEIVGYDNIQFTKAPTVLGAWA
jgi:hypothetical protein